MTTAVPTRTEQPAGPADNRPAFLITIDTEGDNVWSRPAELTTRNAACLPRFQGLCERYGLRPTYLCDWEMCQSQVLREFAADVLGRGAGEFGMHIHPANTPPLAPLGNLPLRAWTNLVDYPEDVIEQKMTTMTRCIEDMLGVRPVSHRVGRWALDERCARVLARLGYQVDCSVTPHILWGGNPAMPGGRGKPTDYRRFPDRAYFLDLNDISRPGSSKLLEVPMTVLLPGASLSPGRLAHRMLTGWAFSRRVVYWIWPGRWLRPNGRNRRQMLDILREALSHKRDYVEFMLHSSEFMPGGSPWFSAVEQVDAMFDDVEAVFAAARDDFLGLTLSEYRQRFISGSGRL